MSCDSSRTLYRRMGILKYMNCVVTTHYDDLQQTFGVSRPTIAEDLYFLQNSMEVPIESKAGRNGYVRLKNPVEMMFCFEEAETDFLVHIVDMLEDEKDKLMMMEIIEKYSGPYMTVK